MRSGGRDRRWRSLAVVGALALLGGCHHRQVVATQPAVLKAPDAPPPVPPSPTMEGPPPSSVATAPRVKVTAAKPKPTRRRAAKASVPVVASAAPAPPPTLTPSPATLGELSPGGDDQAKTQLEAAGLIASIEERLKALAPATTEQQSQVRNVRLFLKESKEALGMGDALGAKTLATKAKLLLDDMGK